MVGLVTGLWLFLLVPSTGGNPLPAFLVVAPPAMMAAYAVDWTLGYVRGEDAGRTDDPDPSEPSSYEPADEESAVARLRERYAAGDIDHEEFVRRVDALLETEPASVGGGRARTETREPTGRRERTRTLDGNEAN